MFTSLKKIQEYIEVCEQIQSKVYLPATRTTEVRGNYEGKLVFKHVQIRLVASNEPLMGCGPLPDWLRKKHCVYALDTLDYNLCVWRCLAIYKRHARGETNQVSKRNLAREYYGDNKLKRKDVRPTNIMLYEPKKNARPVWQLVYGKIQHKSDLPIISMRLLKDHCFYIKKIDVLCGRWEYKGCRQIFTRNEDLTVHLKEEKCTGGEKIIFPGGKFKHIVNSSEKVFYGGDTKFS